MKLNNRLTLSALTLSVLVLSNVASAETIVSQTYSGSYPASISGTLANQGTVLEESFTLASPGSFTAFTTSYAGGGFEPNLTLYNSSGIAVASQWATPPPGASADPNTGLTADGYLSASNLDAGMYTLALSDWLLQQDPTAASLSDGFKFNLGDGVTFTDSQGNTRTGDYALSVDVTSASTAVPEPASVFLLAPVLLGAWLLRKRVKVSY